MLCKLEDMGSNSQHQGRKPGKLHVSVTLELDMECKLEVKGDGEQETSETGTGGWIIQYCSDIESHQCLSSSLPALSLVEDSFTLCDCNVTGIGLMTKLNGQ